MLCYQDCVIAAVFAEYKKVVSEVDMSNDAAFLAKLESVKEIR
jgi:hypothetical protein